MDRPLIRPCHGPGDHFAGVAVRELVADLDKGVFIGVRSRGGLLGAVPQRRDALRTRTHHREFIEGRNGVA